MVGTYIVQGADMEFRFTINDQNGNPINLSGAMVQLKGDTFTKACDIEDAAAAIVSVWLGPEELTKGDHLYRSDIAITLPDGTVFKAYEQVEFYVRRAV